MGDGRPFSISQDECLCDKNKFSLPIFPVAISVQKFFVGKYSTDNSLEDNPLSTHPLAEYTAKFLSMPCCPPRSHCLVIYVTGAGYFLQTLHTTCILHPFSVSLQHSAVLTQIVRTSSNASPPTTNSSCSYAVVSPLNDQTAYSMR